MQLTAAKALLAAGDFSSDTLRTAYAAIHPEDASFADPDAWPHMVNNQPVWPEDLAEQALHTVLDAAMYRRLGHETQLSRSGSNVVFAPAYRLSRADRSGMLAQALAQLQHAGIDWQSLTQAELEAYQAWLAATRHRTAVEQAFFLITRPFNEAYSGAYGAAGMFNNVRLKNGLGFEIATARIECLDVRLPGGKFGIEPNYPAIEKAIARFREEHPDYRAAPVRDNNLPYQGPAA
ncbi:hypothetical protein [Geopseudomonas aromaticivorans]